MIKIVSKNIDKIVVLFFAAFLISDFVTKLAYGFFHYSFYRFSGSVKLIFEILMVLLILIHSKKSILEKGSVVIGLTIVFIIGQYISSNNYDFKFEVLSGSIYFFNRYVYILIFILFVNTVKIKNETWFKVIRFVEYFLYVNALAILLGVIFDFEIFRSYSHSPRFGYNGLISRPGESSYLYICVIIANYYLFFLNKKKLYRNKLLFFIFCSFFLGQKKMFLFLFLLFLFDVIYIAKHKKYLRLVLLSIIAIGIFFWKNLLAFVLKIFPYWKNLYEDQGALGALTSNRNKLLTDAIDYIKLKWNSFNYIFGGLDIKKFKVEFEFIDLYLFLGVFGVFYYFYIVYQFTLKKDLLMKSLIFIAFATSFVSGGLILNITPILLLYIISNKYLYVSNK